MKKQALTLGEVLVTLAIIGVVAAMTVPTLNQNTKKNEYVTGCLKAYSSLTQAINRMKVDWGMVGIGKKWNTSTDVIAELKKQFNVIDTTSSWNTRGYKFLDGSDDTAIPGDGFMTTDGMLYIYYAGNCSGKGITDTDVSRCLGRFIVDVNGDKGPNRYGHDTFFFVLIKGKGLIPAGSNSTADCTTTGKGISCAARVINEKKINY